MKKILDVVEAKGPIACRDLAKEARLPPQTCASRLIALRTLGLILRDSKGRWDRSAAVLNGKKTYKPFHENVYSGIPLLVAHKFEELGLKTGKLVEEKNAAYGDSVRNSAKIMQILYPRGISTKQLPAALVTVRIIDKLSRISHDPEYGGEDPAQDITGYGLLLQELVKNGL